MKENVKKVYTEKQKEQRRRAVRAYENRNFRLNITFPQDTKKRVEDLELGMTTSAFVRDTVLKKLDELEKQKFGENRELAKEVTVKKQN